MLLKAVVPALAAFCVSALLGPLMIPALTRLKCGQYIREEGPEAHKKKAGTPTMGGIVFLLAMAAAMGICAIFFDLSHQEWAILITTAAFGLIGFLDDFLKVVLKHNEGLKPLPKFILQIIFAAGFAFYLNRIGYGTKVYFQFFGDFGLDLGLFFYLFVVFYMVAFNNGTNFTDGLDGLCSSVTAIIALLFVVVGAVRGDGVTAAPAAMLGGLMGFLLFNSYPARVFMGDTGSLALGGFVCACALLLKMPMLLLLAGFVYVAEVLSVIIQVAYFKATKGKRIFRMAPIHHHFELGGWPETKVVAVFRLVRAALCLLCLILLS